MKKLEWTGERYVPWADDFVTAYEHLHRYGFVREFVHGKKVLDLACGEGYGSFMLSEAADSVTGIDIDDLSITHAQAKYIKENLSFIQGSITQVPVEGKGIFDVIVCFEALEHIEEHDELMKEVKRLLKENGIFIVSTPNKYIYSDLPNYHNPFHVKELYLEEFNKLLSDIFKNVYLYGQKVYPSSNIFPLFKISEPSTDLVVEMTGSNEFAFLSTEKKIARYFIAVASDAKLTRGKMIGSSYLIDQSESTFRQKNGRIADLEGIVRQKEEQFKQKEQQVLQKEDRIKALETDVKNKESVLSEKGEQLKQKEDKIKTLQDVVDEKDEEIIRMSKERSVERQRLEENLRQRDEQIKLFEAGLTEKEEDIVQLKETIEEKDDILRLKDNLIKQMYEKITALEDEKIGSLEEEIKKLSDKRRLLEEESRIERQKLENEISDRDRRINDLLNSKSWKVTKLLRTIHELFIGSK
ncbi:MAG: methyltransferase domain-containing protein [Nitrospirae bacterium]|nr:methyltransferase domain-containing protein [Nitrospirota bacterium]